LLRLNLAGVGRYLREDRSGRGSLLAVRV